MPCVLLLLSLLPVVSELPGRAGSKLEETERFAFFSDPRFAARVLPLIRRYESRLVEKLSRHYRHPWPERKIPVDLVSWASRGGANTIGAGHVLLSSGNPGYQGEAGLEMTFHEASHLLIGGDDEVTRALYAANRGRMLPRRDLWHAVLFHTTGVTVRGLLAADGIEYRPYAYTEGLFTPDRGWGAYREPMEMHWQPYLDGEIDLETAARRLLAAIHGER